MVLLEIVKAMKVLTVIAVLVAVAAAQRRTSCNCGVRRQSGNRIVGGTESGVNEWPSMAGLFEVTPQGRAFQFCGATIITKKHVITAAHCLRSRDELDNIVDKMPRQVRVLVAGHDWLRASPSQFLEVTNIAIHERYDDRKIVNDIAMITVMGQIRFSEIISPVCFPNARLNLDKVRVTAVGWGATFWTGIPAQTQTPSVLRKVDLTANMVDTCARIMPGSFDVFFNRHQLCTYNPGQSVCPGDSGGPLYWLDTEINRYVLAGISSFVPRPIPGTPGCQNLSGFVDPSAFIDWVRARLGGESVCTKI